MFLRRPNEAIFGNYLNTILVFFRDTFLVWFNGWEGKTLYLPTSSSFAWMPGIP